MAQNTASCSELEAIYSAKREAGLVDVKFLLRNEGDASRTEVCNELVAINHAIQFGNDSPLQFDELRLKKAS